MANEPRINLKSVTTRLDLEDYARIVMLVGDRSKFKDTSSCLRSIIHEYVSGIVLDDERKKMVDEMVKNNILKRQEKHSKRRGLFRRLFG